MLVYHPIGMSPEPSQPRPIGRYLLYSPIASGGMASVHLGRLVGDAGFSRTVAIKRLHPALAEAPEIAESLRDEARIVARIQHPNVVAMVDLLLAEDEAFLVMEYVRGESLARLLRAARARGAPAPVPIVASIACGALHGLHAAHEACSESGDPLGIVHRDVSPENVLVGVDGTARLLDFGIAKARGRLSTTRGGQIKGKLAYMAPEQLLCADVTRRTDVFAAGAVLWEALAGCRLFDGGDEGALIRAVLEKPILPPSSLAAHVPPALDAIVLRALERNAEGRYPTARELAVAIEDAVPLASPRAVGEWVEELAGDALARRAARVAAIESASAAIPSAPATPSAGAAALGGPSEPRGGSGLESISQRHPGRGLAETAPAIPSRALDQGMLAAEPPPGSVTSSVVSLGLPATDGTRRDGPPPMARKRARPRLALLGALVLGGAAVLAAQSWRRAPPGPEDAARAVHAPAAQPASASAASPTSAVAASPTSAVAASPTSTAAADPASAAAADPASAAAADPASAAAADPANAVAPAPAQRPARPAAGTRAPIPAARATRADAQRCSPPYTVDKAGIRRLKPECL
ncbi:serine/threonine-protein kinase [Sorangium atrum]|uniref:Serine/threonine-protein kinase n=1 Tax=Sorangium atrum TaxID=2995308 RepID=A0ABT5BTA3_9BACT|nr:serine/threonine-protein kinase [Sorangium aterium]MDC0676131.1 serine/threonine-protein kinase [Sorangium aterium]